MVIKLKTYIELNIDFKNIDFKNIDFKNIDFKIIKNDYIILFESTNISYSSNNTFIVFFRSFVLCFLGSSILS